MFNTSILRNNILSLWTSFMDNFIFPEEYQKYIDFIPIFLIGLVATFLITPIIGNIAQKNSVVYIPNTKRKNKKFENAEKAMHEGIIPALGGVAVLIPLIIAIPLFFKIDSTVLPFLIAISILLIGGIFDDILDIPAKTQLIFQILASLIIAVSILDIPSFSVFGISIPMEIFSWKPSLGGFSFSLNFPGDLFLFVWMIFCINSFKWTAGSPGLIEGNTFIISILIFIISIRFQVLFTATMSALAAGSLLAFLIFAYPPPLIMTGSSGKSVYGLLLCTLALISQAKFATTLMLLLLPSLDAVFVLIRRYLTYKPKNPLDLIKISDTTHFHHHLLKMNLSRKQVFWIEILITLAIGSLAITITGAYRYLLLILAILIIASTIFFANLKAKKDIKEKSKKESSESRYSY